MILLYILIGLVAVYLAYSFGIKKGSGQTMQPMQDQTDANMHSHSHSNLQKDQKKHGGGCC